MSEGQLIYLNGEFVDPKRATVSVFDHGFLYGDGIFEGIRAYGGNIFRLRQHIVRLYESAKSILLQIPLTFEEMQQAVAETVRRNGLKDAYIRLVVSRGPGDLGLDPHNCSGANVIIIADQIKLYPQEFYDQGLRVVTVPTRRNNPDALNPKIKSLNYLNNILTKIEASRAGALEALILNQDGYVCEASGDNVFIVKNGRVITPPTYLGALEGITRNAIIEICQREGIPVAEEPFTRHDVFVADECFLTGTAAELIPVVEVDGREIGRGVPGEMTKRLLEHFRALTRVDGYQVYPEAASHQV
ncbi:branched-chain-amino-acid transaminase [Kyrpidia spormannii]|uniref:Branched-chain-amino-acid aminotransferase n=2 Tax=Kyrpidia TaxID=1129704 RepID=A0A2K8N808_9BACL|nr:MULTISPECIES: branched-chain-amino-acid transaminase [Kyrpidia]ADG05684.1 branched-chain amino acid aminotransferase [Kyrpidia tusciae DSM 2912]ATY85471.1 branched-chain-amino-acid transaminase [Kyrpidia spormannii]